MTISYAVDLYLAELARNGASKRSRHRYQWLLFKLCDRYPHADVDEITTNQLRRFQDEWIELAEATQAQQTSCVKCFFRWLEGEGHIPVDPAAPLRRPRVPKSEDRDDLVGVSGEQVRQMMALAENWIEVLCLALLAYTAGRRRAVSNLKLKDYNRDRGEITLREKGKKTITKPVPHELRSVLDAAIDAGLYHGGDSFLIPNHQTRRRTDGTRDDRIVYDTVKKVAKRAGVESHVHALRAAFAVEFLEQNPDQLFALKELMGHERLETTLVYLRRANRRKHMETVVDFSWKPSGGASSGDAGAAAQVPSAAPVSPVSLPAGNGVVEPNASLRVQSVPAFVFKAEFNGFGSTEKEGFEPSFVVSTADERIVSEHSPEPVGDVGECLSEPDLLETLGLPLEQAPAKLDLLGSMLRAARQG